MPACPHSTGTGLRSIKRLIALALAVLANQVALADAAAATFRVAPASVELEGTFARAQLLATSLEADGGSTDRSADLTRQAVYASSNPQVVTVSDAGALLAVGNGQAVVSVTAGGEAIEVPVVVSGVEERPSIGFVSHVLPVLKLFGYPATFAI
ncbi:MAG: hypothetical protein WD278_06995, partial [Pirellulales bacterium]